MSPVLLKILCALFLSSSSLSSSSSLPLGRRAGGTLRLEAQRKLAIDGDPPSFSYRTATRTDRPYGPSEWHLDFERCNGTSQSPINLSASVYQNSSESSPLRFYPAACDSRKVTFSKGDHFLKVGLEGCNEVPSLEYNGSMYEVLQMHVHSASEHTIGGAHHDAEVHLVHVKEGTDDELLVVGILLDASRFGDNSVIEDMWDIVRLSEVSSRPNTTSMIHPYDLVPATPSFVMYSGSLTTPPCTEGVTWIVMMETILMSYLQLAFYRRHVAELDCSVVSEFGGTNRPLQLLNGRKLMYYT